MTEPPEETRAQPVEVTCPGCFHPREWDVAGVCPICHYRAGMEGRSVALLPVGTQLKGYVVGEKLGQGGFGITYRGFDVTLKMKVAIKEYYPSELVGRSTDRKTVVLNAHDHEELFHYGLRTFLQEAQTVAQLRHPHLVRVLNYFELNDTAYLVMDYYEGEDLARHLKPPKGQAGVQMPWRRALKLLLPVLDGLRKVHQVGFMHRDLKPGNLYLTQDDELIVLDFGSARQVTGTHTRSLLIFSEGYAPYEQYLQGHLNRQGPWTDIYGAAATLYFMLTAQRLPSALERKQAVLLQQPDPLQSARHWVPDLPLALDAALLRALAVEPDQRPSSVAEFKRLLEAALMTEEESTRPKPPPQPRSAPKPPPRPQAAPIQPPPASAAVAKPPHPKASPPPTGVPSPSTSPKGRMAMVVIAVIGLIALGGWQFWEKFGVTPNGDGTVTSLNTVDCEHRLLLSTLVTDAIASVQGLETAFTKLKDKRDRFDRILLKKKNELPKFYPLIENVEIQWKLIKMEIDIILTNREIAVTFGNFLPLLNSSITNINMLSNDIAKSLANNRADSRQRSLANKQLELGEQIANDLQNPNTAVAADRLKRNVSLFGQNLRIMREGGQSIKRVTIPESANKLSDLAEFFKTLEPEIVRLIERSPGLIKLKNASQKITEQSDILVKLSSELFGECNKK